MSLRVRIFVSCCALVLLIAARSKEVDSWRRSSKFAETFLSVIFVGKTGTGKSTTANTLLEEEKFSVSGAFESVTKHVQYGDADFNDKTYRIFDTPGYLDVDISSIEVTEQIADWVRSSSHGLDAFVLLLPYGRLGKEHWESFQTFKNSFGISALNRTVVAITQLRPASLSSEQAAADMIACCKSGGKLRQACCEVKELWNQGNPVIGIGDPSDPERRAKDRAEIFNAIQTVIAKYPQPYSNRFFDEIHTNRTKLLQEINLLKFNHHRSSMRKLYEQYYAPEVIDNAIGNNMTIAELWTSLREFQREEMKKRDGMTAKWAYRFIASVFVSLTLEALVGISEPLQWVERSYRTMLFFALYCALCITDLGTVGLHALLNQIPPLWIFDVTSLIDLYFKLDDIIPLGAAATVHAIYIVTHTGLRYVCNFFEALYLGIIVATLVHEIVVHGLFEPGEGEMPIERWSFITMVISMLLFACQFDDDFTLDSDSVPVPIWRFRMVWRRPVVTQFEPVETDTNLYDEVPEDDYPMRWRRVDTAWDLDLFRNERLERLAELDKTVRLWHKDKGNEYTVQALASLPPVTISLPSPNVGADVEWRTIHTIFAVLNGIGAMLLFWGYTQGICIAAIDVLLLLQRLCTFVWYSIISADPEVDRVKYSDEWIVSQIEVKD